MAKKPDPKPLFAVKHDFVDSLDRFLEEVTMFRQAVKYALDLGQIQTPAREVIAERLAALDKATSE